MPNPASHSANHIVMAAPLSPSVTLSTAVRVVIIAECRLVREALRTALADSCAVDVVGASTLGPEVSQLIESLKAAVVVVHFPALALEDVKQIQSMRQRHAGMNLLVVLGSADDVLLVKLLRAGAKGYLLREAGISDLVKAIHAVDSGELWVERRLLANLLQTEAVPERLVADYCARPGAKEELTAREQEVLRVLASGLANKEIGRTLFISEKTVKTHLSSIFRKLHVGRRLAAVVYAMQGGLGPLSISRRGEADLDQGSR